MNKEETVKSISLDEAAKDYALAVWKDQKPMGFIAESIIDFKAGAEWQKKQDKQIIERLILDIQCIIEDCENSFPNEIKFTKLLEKTGAYRVYPPYKEQTDAHKKEIQDLLKLTL